MKYKYNGQWIDVNIKALDSMVIGSVIDFAGKEEKIPVGWLICDGSAVSRTEYSDLFDAIGTNWGTGDGSTTFNLPPAGIVRVGYDANDTDFNAIGKTGGSKELQAHSHEEKYESFGLSSNKSALTDYSNSERTITFNADHPSTGVQTGTAGTGNSGNLQPYGTFYTLIKAKNTTPTMASIVNATNSSTTDAYSCDYVNKLHKYSTTEQVVGTWIDGKPIYRKVIVDTTSRGAGNYSIAHNISNLSDITHIETLCWQNSTTMFNGTSTTPLSGSERVTSYLNGANISIRNSWECVKVVIIIEYTKTTN